MKQEVALLYNFTEERLRRVEGLLIFMGVRVRTVEPANTIKRSVRWRACSRQKCWRPIRERPFRRK